MGGPRPLSLRMGLGPVHGLQPLQKHRGKGEAMALRLQSHHKLGYASDYVFATYKPHPNYGRHSDNLVCCKNIVLARTKFVM